MELEFSGKSTLDLALDRAKTPNVILIGGTGSGKSTAGRQLANLVGFGFIDTDDVIVKKLGKPIDRVFGDDGEAAFRQAEAEVIAGLDSVRNHIIVVGAGAVDNPDNWDNLKKLGPVIWVSTPVSEIMRRLVSKPDELRKRPLLAEGAAIEKRTQREEFLMGKLSELEKLRASFYSRADFRLEASYLTSETLAQFMKMKLCGGTELPTTP